MAGKYKRKAEEERDMLEDAIYKNTNLALLFLAKQFVFTLLKPITLDSYFKNNY